ncbi:hypothetical protein [Streptomyces tauricus]|uniref:hypothetical protein n=1 Tax=Streptomyces tauricus TaxID=68274 RepID=UPI0033AF61C2
MTEGLLPEPIAYRITCEGVLAGDPRLLAEPGQVRQLRPGAADPAPGMALLVIVHRNTDQLIVELEDDDAPCLQIPLCALAAYELTQWCWLRDDPDHTSRATGRHGPVPDPPGCAGHCGLWSTSCGAAWNCDAWAASGSVSGQFGIPTDGQS